jgi:hypothetical protein
MSMITIQSRMKATFQSLRASSGIGAAPAFEHELSSTELDQVVGGRGLLLPAVQKLTAETAASSRPVETFSLNF